MYKRQKAILLGLVGIVGGIDSRLIGRQNIGRPLILSTLAGLVLGDVRQGVILGASLELISMGFVAIGAAGPPNMQFGSIFATAFAMLSGASTEAAPVSYTHLDTPILILRCSYLRSVPGLNYCIGAH